MTRIERAKKWIDANNKSTGLHWLEMVDGQFHSHTVKITEDSSTLAIGESSAFYCIDVWDNNYEAFIEIYDDNQEVAEQIEKYFSSIDDAANWCNEHALKQNDVSFVWYHDCGYIEEVIKMNSDSKKQPVKEQTLDEVNNPETGEKARFVMRNGDDVVAIDDYVNDKYLYKK